MAVVAHLFIKQNKDNMFTLEQIKAAHSKVKTGADFPAYIRDLKKIGVTFYETFLVDGHTVFSGDDEYELVSPPKYHRQTVSTAVNASQLREDIRNHQEGGSDFPTITKQVAGNGIEKWAVCMEAMTCTYYDMGGNKVMVEVIPEVSEAVV